MIFAPKELAVLQDLLAKEIGRTRRIIIKYEDNILQGLPYEDKLRDKRRKLNNLLLLDAKLKGGAE